MFNGRPDDLNADANFLTDSIEPRSNSMASTLAEGISLSIFSLFVCFVLCCAGKEEGETGVTYFKSFWVGTIVIEIN